MGRFDENACYSSSPPFSHTPHTYSLMHTLILHIHTLSHALSHTVAAGTSRVSSGSSRALTAYDSGQKTDVQRGGKL